MKTRPKRIPNIFYVLFAVCLLGMAGCSSGDGTAGSALPQPSVDCGGESCID